MPNTARHPVPADAARPTYGSPLSLAVAFLTLLVIGTDLFVVSPLLPAIANEYAVSPGVAGTSVTVFSIAYMVGAPLGGALADRLGRRALLIIGLLGFAGANVLTGLSSAFGVLLAARVLAGLFAAGVTPSMLALVGQSAPPARRGAWMSTAMAGFLISLTTGAPTGTALASILGWKAAFVGLGFLAVLLALANRFVWPSGAGAVSAEHRGSATLNRLPLTTKLRAVSITGIWAFSVYAFYTYLGTGLQDVAGLSTGLVASALIVYGIGAVIGSLGGGRLADRYGAARVATVSLVLLSATMLVMDLLIHAPTAVLLVALGLFALTAYPFLPGYQSRLVATFPAQSGSVLAWNSFFMYLGTSVGAALGGVMLSTAGFRLIPVVSAVAALIGAVVYHRWALLRAAGVETTEEAS